MKRIVLKLSKIRNVSFFGYTRAKLCLHRMRGGNENNRWIRRGHNLDRRVTGLYRRLIIGLIDRLIYGMMMRGLL